MQCNFHLWQPWEIVLRFDIVTQSGYIVGLNERSLLMPAVLARSAEIKTRTTPDVKSEAKQVYSNWGLSLSDAINIF